MKREAPVHRGARPLGRKEITEVIVRDIMTTKLVTVEPDDTLGHAAQLLRQHQFHHLPVARTVKQAASQRNAYTMQKTLLFEGVLTAQDLEMAAAPVPHDSSREGLHRPWQEQRVVEVMRPTPMCVTPLTAVGAAAQLLVQHELRIRRPDAWALFAAPPSWLASTKPRSRTPSRSPPERMRSVSSGPAETRARLIFGACERQ